MSKLFFRLSPVLLLMLFTCITGQVFAQYKKSKAIQKTSRKIETGINDKNEDSLAQGYFEMGNNYYEQGLLEKSEGYYQKSKDVYQKNKNAAGVAKSSRALAIVQEDLNKKKEARSNYSTAQGNAVITGDSVAYRLNTNDASRLSKPDSSKLQQQALENNVELGLKNNDTAGLINSVGRLADFDLKNNATSSAIKYYNLGYALSQNKPEQALRFNQKITDAYLKDKNFLQAIETKKQVLNEPFVKNSTQIKASEITSLADIYIQKKEDSTAVSLLRQSYNISVQNGHTLEARKCVEKLDSIFRSTGKTSMSLQLYKSFLSQLPQIIDKDSSLVDNKIIAETEERLKQLQIEKALKDDLIRKKNIFNYWLIGSLVLLLSFIAVILFVLKKLRVKNKKIALQSLRREMNPHFIFNSLNSINQFIASNNELAANQYLTRFSTLMRRVMENSKEDFVQFSKEAELLQNYLELERSRFPDKFDFKITIDDALFADEDILIPGMLIQPHLENSIWHGLRYMETKGFLQLSFTKKQNNVSIVIEDNGVGIAESKKNKTVNQQKHGGRGMNNTLERIKILNELYHQNITCVIEDKPKPATGVKITLTVPITKTKTA
ncbi:MAG: histidine kinase [Ferruginibacter sp.]|nr:histidine kinase [Ferruginibacter sp.]